MTQPDRFEKMVEQVGKETGYYALTDLGRTFGLKLLRRQFAAVRRIVKKEPSCIMVSPTEYRRGVIDTCDIILAKLDRWRKGTP